MKLWIIAAFLIVGHTASKEMKSRELILTDQELRFAGNALHTVLASNANSYRGRKGNRRFSGTFSIVERENREDFDVRINADVDLMNGYGNNGNRNRYPNSNYNPSNFGNSGRGTFSPDGYAGHFSY